MRNCKSIRYSGYVTKRLLISGCIWIALNTMSNHTGGALIGWALRSASILWIATICAISIAGIEKSAITTSGFTPNTKNDNVKITGQSLSAFFIPSDAMLN